MNKQESEEVIRNIDKAENITIVRLNKFRKEIFFTLKDDEGIERGYSASFYIYVENKIRKRMIYVFRYKDGVECIKRSYEEDVDLRSSVKEVLSLVKGREIG